MIYFTGCLLFQNALENSFVSSSIQTMLGVDGNNLLKQLESLSAVTPDDAKQLKILSNLAANITRCVENDRLEAYRDEEAVEQRAIQLSRTNRVLAGQQILCFYYTNQLLCIFSWT